MIIIPVAPSKADIVKEPGDVHFKAVVSRYSGAKGTPWITILDPSADNQVHEKVFRNIDGLLNDKSKTGMSKTFDTTSEVYANALNVFNVTGFNQSIRVVEYPSGSSSLSSASANSNGQVSASEEPGIVKAMADHIWDGTYMVLPTKNVKESDLEALSDFLYDNQRVAILEQFSAPNQLAALDSHVKSYQTDKSAPLHNVWADVESSQYRYPVAEAAAMVTVQGAHDNFKHFRNGTNFVPNKFNGDQLQTIDDNEGSTVVNRAGDAIFSSGKAMGGGYIDQLINAQIVVDRFTYAGQSFVNEGHPYTDKSINLLKQTLTTAGGGLLSDGYLTSAPTINIPSYAEEGGDNIELRDLQNVQITGVDITSFIEHIDGEIDMTV